MSREKATVSREVHNVLVARWEGFKKLAKVLPDHQILAVELIRTLNNETVAVFTTVRRGEPIRTVVRGDARGRVKANTRDHSRTIDSAEAALMAARAAPATDPAEDPGVVALGEPPPKQGGTPGIIAVGSALLAETFDVAEFVDISE